VQVLLNEIIPDVTASAQWPQFLARPAPSSPATYFHPLSTFAGMTMKHHLLALALLAAPAMARAQSSSPATYEFLTVVETQAQQDVLAKVLFASAFQGKTEVQLEHLPGMVSAAKYVNTFRHNLELVNQQLELVTAAGWELVQASSSTVLGEHEYLFRRLKK
jgi:hypothetical protein